MSDNELARSAGARDAEAGAQAVAEAAAERLAILAAGLGASIATGCRAIRPGDACHLTPAETAPLARAVASVRDASGAARCVARALLRQAGHADPVALVPQRPGGPRWPPAWVGTLAHDSQVAVAAIAPRARLRGLGIDVEPAEPLPHEIYDRVVTAREHGTIRGDLIAARLLFVVKEAVYKATHPLDATFLNHHDVEVDLAAAAASTRTGHQLAIAYAPAPRLLALAILR